MNPDDRLKDYLDLCQRIYLKMERDGTWPWSPEDSQTDEDLVESEDNP